MSVLVWVHDHIVWLLLGVVPCAAAIGWGLWLGRYQPAHAGGPVPERLWPLVGDPRAGSMQLEDDHAWKQQPQRPAAAAAYAGEYPLAAPPVSRSELTAPLDWREVAHEEDWRDQTAAALAPAVLDSGPGGLAWPGPDPDHIHNGSCSDDRCWDGGPGRKWAPEPEPEPVWTVAGRLVETSGEWLRRLEVAAAERFLPAEELPGDWPGWTWAGTVAA